MSPGDNRVYDTNKRFGVPVLSRLPPLLHAVIRQEVAHGSVNLTPQLWSKNTFAPGVIHSLEVLEESVLKCAKSKFRNSVQIVEAVHAAKKKRRKLRVFVQRPCQIAPLLRQSIHCRLATLPVLLAQLDCKVNDGRNSDKNRSQLPNRC